MKRIRGLTRCGTGARLLARVINSGLRSEFDVEIARIAYDLRRRRHPFAVLVVAAPTTLHPLRIVHRVAVDVLVVDAAVVFAIAVAVATAFCAKPCNAPSYLRDSAMCDAIHRRKYENPIMRQPELLLFVGPGPSYR